MKQKLLVIGILVFAVLCATQAGAQPCRRMAGAMNAAQEDWGCPIWQSLAPEQQTAINSLRDDFIKKTSAIQNKVHKKRLEMDILLLEAEPDAKQLMGLQKEISALEATLDEELLAYQIKARKELTPEQIAQLPPGCAPGLGNMCGSCGGRGARFGIGMGGGMPPCGRPGGWRR
jgi:Spy/CpxP family protein refolding chaperone